MVLGIIIGLLVAEDLRKALMLDPSVLPFVTRPLSLILILALVLVLVGPFVHQRRARPRRAKTEEG